MKIAKKIGVVYFVSAVLMTIIALTIIYLITRNAFKESMGNHLASLVRSRAHHAVTYLDASEESVKQLSKSILIKRILSIPASSREYGILKEEVMERINDTVAAKKDLLDIDITNAQGIVVASTNYRHSGRPRRMSGGRLRQHGRILIEDVYWDPEEEKGLMGFAAPVEDKNEIRGMVYMKFRLDTIEEIVGDLTGMGESGEAYLINENGYMITPSRFMENTFLKVGIGSQKEMACFDRADASVYDLRSCADYRGVKVVGVYTAIPELKWTLVSEIEAKEAWSLLGRIRGMLIALTAIIPLLAWAIGRLLALLIMKPLQALRVGAEIIGDGNLYYTTNIRTDDEIGELSQAFDEMTEHLRKTTISRDYINNIIESMNYSLIVVSPDCMIEMVNEATLKMLDYQREELLGKKLDSVFAGTDEERCICEEMKELIRQGKIVRYERFYKTKKGKLIPVLFSSTVLKEKGARHDVTAGILCVAEDISERKQAQEALRESERRLSEVVQGITLPIFVIDKEHRIMYWNRACEKLTGLPAEEMTGTSDQWKAFYAGPRPCLADLLLEDDPEEKIRIHYQSAYWIKRKTPRGAYEIEDFFSGLGEDGKWLHGTASLIRDSKGEAIAVIETVEDITERKHAEEEIRESQRRTSEIIQGCAIPLFVIDKDHRVTHWNRACEKLTGFSAEEIVGTRKHWIPFYSGPRPCLADLVLDRISEDVIRSFYQGADFAVSDLMERSYDVEMFFSGLGEQGCWLRFTAALIRDSKGEVIAAIETLEDITERKKLFKLKDEFVSNVSHELRTPLTTIREAVAQMNEGILGQTTTLQREVLSIGLSDIDRLTRIINNLLDISRIEAGEVEIRREPVDIVSLTKEVIVLFTPQAQSRKLELRHSFSREKMMIYIDRDKIKQVFTNLVGNAMKFTSQGYIEVVVKEKDSIIECKVRDSGIGISEHDLPFLFSKFYQIGRGAGPGEKGTGLGLSIAKGIVELHGGGIFVESRPEKGTVFTVLLPKYTPRELFAEHLTKGLGEALKENRLLAVLIFKITNLIELGSMMDQETIDAILHGLQDTIVNNLHRQTDRFIRDKNTIYVMFCAVDRDDVAMLRERITEKIKHYLKKKVQKYLKIKLASSSVIFPDDGTNAEELLSAAEKHIVEKEREHA